MTAGLTRRAFLAAAATLPLGRAMGGARQVPTTPRTADVVVVGGGPAAYAAVFRLAQFPDLTILLIDDVVPWQPRDTDTVATSIADLPPFVRGHEACFAAWRDRGNDGWGYADVVPFFKRLERYEAGASDTRGGSGPLSVRHCWDPNAGHRAFLMAAVPAGFRQDSRHDFNGPRSQGVAGYYQKAALDDRPHTFEEALLGPVRARVSRLSGGHVGRLVMSGTRAVGVEYVTTRSRAVIGATRAVLLCGDPVRTAQLLMLSGVGPADQLRALGVPVVVDLAGVGRNLHDQIRVPLRYQSRQALAPSTVSAGMFTVSLAASPPDLQLDLITPSPGDALEIGIDVRLVRPASRGQVTLATANAADAPVVSMSALSAAPDVTALAQGVRLGRLVMTGTPFDPLRGDETAATAAAQHTSALEQAVRALMTPCGHRAGTCAMGPRPGDGAVVDARLAVHGVQALLVAGTAVMPEVVNAPPAAAALMIGDRSAEFVLAGPAPNA